MANGRGHLDCGHCIHWEGEYYGNDVGYEEGFCKLFETKIPSTLPNWNHRICGDFKAAESFNFYAEMRSVEERFGWFEIDFEKGVLYEYPYNCPPEIKKLKNLTK